MTATETPLKWHLRDNWAPVLDERTDTDLRVDGAIPPEIDGGVHPHRAEPGDGFVGTLVLR